MGETKYSSQIKNLRKNYVRFPLDLKPEVLDAFRAACAAKGTTPTTEIKRFISDYIAQEGDPGPTRSPPSRRPQPGAAFFSCSPPRAAPAGR